MKVSLFIVIVMLGLASCKSKVQLDENLPKDIALKKVFNKNYSADSATLRSLQAEIVNSIADISCDDAQKWKIAAIGSKPCGGPANYIAYPIEIEEQILPKIKTYTIQESGFNEKYGIVSDCMMETEPTGILCVEGKAELQRSTLSEQ